VFSPSIILPPASAYRCIIPARKNSMRLSKTIFSFCVFKNWVSLKLLKAGRVHTWIILKVVHGLVHLIYLDYNTGGGIQSKMNEERHLSLSGDVSYSLRFSCKTLEARVVEILSSASYFRGSRFESCFGIRLSSLDL